VIRVAGDIRIPLACLPAGALEHLRRAATVTIRTRQSRFGNLVWIDEGRDLSRIDGTDLVLPRGMVTQVQQIVGPQAEWRNETTRADHAFDARIEWRPHQVDAASIAARKVQGIHTAATGAGKTGCGYALLTETSQRAIVLVPTTALAAQWGNEGMRFLGVETALNIGGKWADAPIVITTPATAMRHVERLHAYGVLLLDECQGYATEIRADLIAKIPARWRIGLTGTLPRDHRGEILRRVIGPVICRFGVDDGIASGVLVAPTYEQVPTTFSAQYECSEDWPGLIDALVADAARNAQIVDLVMRECSEVCTLVLSSRLVHLDILRDMFVERGARVAILSGQTRDADRAAILAAARAGELDVLLGSTVADEGIDVPGLSALVLAFPGKAEPRLLQRIGRIVRAAPSKPQPQIFDFVDDVGPLRRQAELRRQAFDRAFGKTVQAA
jgi:superfamily II DNA or RNA helicase